MHLSNENEKCLLAKPNRIKYEVIKKFKDVFINNKLIAHNIVLILMTFIYIIKIII